MNDKVCKNCKHWKPDRPPMWEMDDDYCPKWGKCTRYPKWMDARRDDYCGEWKDKNDD